MGVAALALLASAVGAVMVGSRSAVMGAAWLLVLYGRPPRVQLGHGLDLQIDALSGFGVLCWGE